MDQNKDEVGKVRLFVGGLSSGVSALDLKERFAPLGTVLELTTPPAKCNPGPHRGFAYVDFLPSSDASLRKLFSAYNGCKWRGGVLRIEVAKEHYTEKLKKEWAADAEALAVKEAEELQKKNAVPEISPVKQVKAWPLLLLEKPENPDKFKRKRDFEQAADANGIKIFFPRLKKMRTVPITGSGKHKRSFQRVGGLPLQHLSTCDCDASLRTGSCDCASTHHVAGNAGDNSAVNNEDDTVSLAIAKERQRQLDLLDKLFPSDSPRKSMPAKKLTTSAAQNKAEIKKVSSGPGNDAKGEASGVGTPSSHSKTSDDSRKLILPEIKDDSTRTDKATVKAKVSDPEGAPPSPEQKEEDTELQADEPEMWVSFMDTMPLPAKTEETVSEFDLDELSMMLSEEEEEESEDGEEEDEEAEEATPNIPKKKTKRKKRKGKKSKQSAKTELENEQGNIRAWATESGSQPSTTVASPSRVDKEVAVPHSGKLPEAETSKADKNAPLQTGGSQEQKVLVNGRGTGSSEDEMDSSDKENGDVSPRADVSGEFYAGISSSDESFDAEADEPELWVSGIDEVQRAPGKEAATHGMVGRSASAVSQVKKPLKASESELAVHAHLSSEDASEEEEDSSMYGASDVSMESEADELENSVSSLKRGGEGDTSEELDSDDEEDHRELWVSGLENKTTYTSPKKTNEVSRPQIPKVSVSNHETHKEHSKAGISASIPSANGDEVPVNETQGGKSEDGSRSTPVAVASLIPEATEEVANDVQVKDSSTPKHNELTRATWKSLVGETGRVVFSLQQVLGGRAVGTTSAVDEGLADPEPEDKADLVEVAEEKDVTSFPDVKKLPTKSSTKSNFQPWQEFSEVDAPPLIPVFTDDNVCPFMRSPDAEKEWLASKSDLRTDYRSKHKLAQKKSRKLRGR
ncbi:hypothetical protein R1flu_013468 [Riccia fluitans]|uniref:RRM domain-containing protein n=1 Tax=Riccia fluitans TaxID=41844 RepID=A0ABD1YGH9_9MARC